MVDNVQSEKNRGQVVPKDIRNVKKEEPKRYIILRKPKDSGQCDEPGKLSESRKHIKYGEFDAEPPQSPGIALKLVALCTAICFLGLIAFSYWPGNFLQLAGLVKSSELLKRDVGSSIMQSVVQITVVHRGNGSLGTAGQKAGTGFNVQPDGVIITNHHVIEGALNITVRFPNGSVYKADQWRSKPESDLAIIYLKAEGLPVIELNYKMPATGDKIKVLGNPRALKNILVEGKVGPYLRISGVEGKVFSLDAPIFPGNSGSPVLDINGKAVGVVFGTMSKVVNGEEKTAGLALCIDKVQELLGLPELEDH